MYVFNWLLGSRIGVWKPAQFEDIGCGKWSEEDGRRPHQDQYWKFVQQLDGTYLMFNKVYRHHRVAAYQNTKLRVYDGATFDDQFFNLELIGGNKVRIINNKGSKLQQKTDKHCLFDANIDMEGSDVWELKPESDFNWPNLGMTRSVYNIVHILILFYILEQAKLS